jgi:UDP-glucose 4-epimerase
MSILLTGGAGYVGNHCVLALLDRNEKVIVVDNLSTGFRNAVHPNALFFQGNAGDKELIKKLIKKEEINTIIHLAASTIVPESTEIPLKYYLNNTSNSRNLIEAAVETSVTNFIFSSTAAVYGAGSEKPLTETNELRPISPYGVSKMMTERMLADAALAGGPRYVILRYFNVAGADPLCRAGQSTARATHLIKVACRTVFSPERDIAVFGTDYPTRDGTCIRDYIHVTDMAQAHVSALDYLRDGGPSEIFNCGYERGYSVLEVIHAVEDVSGRKLNVHFTDRRPGDPPTVVASNAKIRKTLSWRPYFDDLKMTVRHALAWEERLAAFGTP